MGRDILKLRIIGEGPRDKACLPPLLECLLGRQVQSDFKAWPEYRLHRERKQKGLKQLGRKLLFAIKEAREQDVSGVVAVVDRDKGQEDRLGGLQKARERDRETNPPFPTALGQPDPHFEAWLLDDGVAVRKGLGLRRDHAVPNPTRLASAKVTLSELCKAAPATADGTPEIDVLPKVAARIDPSRCPHKKQTGLQAFMDDLQAELPPAVESAR